MADAILLTNDRTSTRNSQMPLAFMPFAGVPILVRSVEAFETCSAVDRVIVTIPGSYLARGRDLLARFDKAICISGNETQQGSLHLALEHVTGDMVVIHDVERPMVTPCDIGSVLNAAISSGAASTFISNEDHVAVIGSEGEIERVIDKSRSVYLQAPQAFRTSLLRRACARVFHHNVVDITQLILALGEKVTLVEGGPHLCKHSHPYEVAGTSPQSSQQTIVNIETAVEEMRLGRPILLIDAEGEGEGDVCVAAEMVTPEIINFMASACRGIICQPVTPEIARRLDLSPLVENGSPAFTVSVDAADVGSGTSAYDRAKTALAIVRPDAKPDDLRRPGHMFPLIARPGGVLERPGHTEASSDLARLAGFVPSAVICEVMTEDGHMAGPNALMEFAAKHKMKAVMVSDLIAYRRQHGVDKSAHLATNIPFDQADIKISRNGEEALAESSSFTTLRWSP